uniref:Uncharacterized protein n=1 Tax=Setaria italica TaxID=4555 RepID=K3ZGC3_SETIT
MRMEDHQEIELFTISRLREGRAGARGGISLPPCRDGAAVSSPAPSYAAAALLLP